MLGKISDVEINRTPDSHRNINEGKLGIGYRWILVILGFTLNFIEFFIRNSFPVALVAMVNSTEPKVDVNLSRDTCISGENKVANETSTQNDAEGDFNWDSSEQGIILGAFFWGFICTKLCASRISEIVGQREIVAIGTGLSVVLVLFAPIAASIHPYALAATRFLTGACFGPSPAAMHSLLSAWAPREELSSMVTTVESGLALGGMVGLVAAGWLTDNFGWQIIFWIAGFLNFLFLPFWILLVRNSPEKHPWLSLHESKLLQMNTSVETKKTVPWLDILFSRYVLICSLCHFARTVLDVILTTEGPSFFTHMIGLKLSTASYVCGANYLSSVVFALMFGRTSDLLMRRKYLSKVNTRKFFHLIACGGSSAMFIGIVFSGCNSTSVIVLWILVGGLLAASACSYLISVIDFAPNYTATVIGITGIGNLGSAVTPLITSALLNKENGWNKTFIFGSAVSLFSCIIYVPFMTAEAQPWNFDDNPKKSDERTEVTYF